MTDITAGTDFADGCDRRHPQWNQSAPSSSDRRRFEYLEMSTDWLRCLICALIVLSLQACGRGGGGDSDAGATSPAPAALPSNLSIAGSGQASSATPVRWQSSLGSGQAGLTMEWTFGDGAGSTEAAPVHTYAEPGSYEVGVTVRNSTWEGVTSRRTVQVAGPQKPRSCTGPGASGWCWQLPRATGPGPEPVIRFGFANAQSGWLVALSSVSKTVDGGKSWTVSTGAVVLLVSTSASGALTLHGTREDDSGTVWSRSTDQGQSFLVQTAVARDKRLQSIGDAGQGVLWVTVDKPVFREGQAPGTCA